MFADRQAKNRMHSRFSSTVSIVAFFALVRVVWFVAALCIWLPKTSTAYTLFFQSLAPVELILLGAVLCGVDGTTGDRLAGSASIRGPLQIGRVALVSPTLAWFLRLRIIDVVFLLLGIAADSVQYAQSDSGYLIGFIVADALIWLEAIGSILLIVGVGIVYNRETETPAEEMRFRGAIPSHHPTLSSLRHVQRIHDHARLRSDMNAACVVQDLGKTRWSQPAFRVKR